MNLWATVKDWGRLVSLIEYATRQQTLDSREGDLIGLLRSSTPRFRSTALKASRHLRYRSELLIAEILRIIEDGAVDSETRILAVEALRHVADARSPYGPDHGTDLEASALLRRLLEKPLPPSVQEAVRQALSTCAREDPTGPTKRPRARLNDVVLK